MAKMLHNIKDATEHLLSYSPLKQGGETYTLSRMRQLMERLGNPQNQLRIIHVAGTSGKTSTSYYVRALLETHGQKTGLTASPHITSLTERVQIAGSPLSDKVFIAYLNEFLAHIEQWQDIRPTYFELLTAFAFWTFHKERVDYAVIEVGLGGLLDATNVIDGPKVCILTPIGLDHTQILGDSIQAIASQKAGIITKASQVFSAVQDPAARTVFEAVCQQKTCHLMTVEATIDTTSQAPEFQQANFALAFEAVTYISKRDRLPEVDMKELRACITNTPPGRFETHQIANKTIILDGAHNPQKLAALVATLRRKHPEPIAWLVGFISAPEAKIENCVAEIVSPTDDYIVTEFSVGQDIKGRHSVAAEEISVLLQSHGNESNIVRDPLEALEELLQSKQRTIVVSGSLYLVAIVRRRVLELAT
jgi:dihydrofolate synthase/folylpolyglutamate synthase